MPAVSTLLPADYVIFGVAIVLAALGLFRGVSGMLAFLLASAVSAIAGKIGWQHSTMVSAEVWIRALAVLAFVLIVFGIVRLVVKKCVNGLLSQPTDAIVGALIGAAICGLFTAVWAWTGYHLEYSVIAQEVARYVR